MSLWTWISTTAVSFTVSGNTGVCPFLSLFIVGVLEKVDPTLLNMDGTIEWILSSWFSIVILGILTILEFVGKCVPVIDTIIDSAMTVVVPIFSILGSLSTFGLLNAANGEVDTDQGRRQLSIASGALIFLQIVVLGVGVILALSMHAVKMLVRLIGEGWLTNCLAVMETLWVCVSIILAVFIRQVAIVIAAIICIAAAYNIEKYLFKGDDKNNDNNNEGQMIDNNKPNAMTEVGSGTPYKTMDDTTSDVEQPK